jgi:hypothetical protein
MHFSESPPPDADAGLERIKGLQAQLALEPRDTTARRELAEVVRIEAGLYCKSLDTRQAAATLSKKFERSVIQQAIPGTSWK